MRLKRVFYVGLILICLSGCVQATPETTIPSPSIVPSLVTPEPTPSIMQAGTTVTPIPTQLAGILKNWRGYEIALAQSMIPSFPTDQVICEWEVLGESVNELYVWAACMTTVPYPQTDDAYPSINTAAVIHLSDDGEALAIERPSGGMNYANEIREMFPVEAQEKFFSNSIEYKRLKDHLLFRKDNSFTPPLYAIDAARPTHAPTPTLTFIESDLPEGLIVAFNIDDTILVWKEGELQELFSGSSIFGASLSYDAEWVKFYQSVNQQHPRNEVWAVRSDGKDLHRLLSTDQITSLTEDDTQLILDQISWLPNSHQLVFNTQELTEGPPGYLPSYDLYLLDISGELTELAGPGEGGNFYPSPDGRYIAAAIPSRIGLFDLETETYNTLLEFESYRGSIAFPRPPVLYWDKDSQFITTTILPKNVYYPYMYEGEPEQIWRLGVEGQTELIVEVDPHPGFGSAVRFSPHAEYYFYFEAGVCLDGAERILHLRSLPDGEKNLEIPCTFESPEWTPDDEHFIYREEGKWTLGNVNDTKPKHTVFLDIPIDVEDYPTLRIQWIDQSYFLQEVKNSDGCTIYLGSLDGIITEIFHTSASSCSGTAIIKPPQTCILNEHDSNYNVLHDKRIYWTDMSIDLWEQVGYKLNGRYPDFSDISQSVYYPQLEKEIEYVGAITIINQASGAGADTQFINPFILLVTVGEDLNWESPPDGDLYHYSKTVRDVLLGHFRNYEFNADIRSQNSNIDNAATYMIYTYLEHDLEDIEKWCKNYYDLIGQDPASDPLEE